MPSSDVVLYHRWKCPWCAAARQAIANVGADVRLIEVSYPREERTDVLEVSGQPRVPVLVNGDETVVGSREIVRHLYERFGGPAFARSVDELTRDIAQRQDEPHAGDVCALPGAA